MIYHACAPRSQEWFLLRLGKPTASQFCKILTPKTSEHSDQAPKYMHRLLAELMLGKPLDDPQTGWMTRGQDLEDQAIDAYEFRTEVDTAPGGFITDDEGRIGCSPDRLVGAVGILEMKCPAPQTHVGYLLDASALEAEKRVQCQGQMYVCEREWVDLVSYHPEIPSVIRRVKRDEKYIGLLKTALGAFVDTLLAARVRLEALYGPFPEIVIRKPAPDDPGALGVSKEDVREILARQTQGRIKADEELFGGKHAEMEEF